MSGEGDLEIFLLVRSEFKGVLLEHHVNLHAVPFFFDKDGFLERRWVSHGAGDLDHRVIERVDVQFGLFVVAIDFHPWGGRDLRLSHWEQRTHHHQHQNEGPTVRHRTVAHTFACPSSFINVMGRISGPEPVYVV